MRLAWLFVLCAVLAAPPCLARVDDGCGVLTQDQLDALSEDLRGVAGHRFDVIFLADTGGDVEAITEAMFARRGLGRADGLVAIFMGSKRVSVHLGDSFKEHGVGSREIAHCLRTEFFPYAKAGRFDDASRAVVRELIARALRLPKPRPLQPEGKTTEL